MLCVFRQAPLPLWAPPTKKGWPTGIPRGLSASATSVFPGPHPTISENGLLTKKDSLPAEGSWKSFQLGVKFPQHLLGAPYLPLPDHTLSSSGREQSVGVTVGGFCSGPSHTCCAQHTPQPAPGSGVSTALHNGRVPRAQLGSGRGWKNERGQGRESHHWVVPAPARWE